MSDHIVKAYTSELHQLSSLISRMGGVAEAQVGSAIQAFAHRDSDLAAHVMGGDAQLDTYEREIDSQAIRLLALRQPMAMDLREIVSALKISADLERIGDLAANIAKRSIALAQLPSVKPASGIPRMGKLVLELLKDVLDAFTDRDLAKAVAVWQRDEELDDLYTSLFREIITYMMEDPRTITSCTHILFIAKNLERIGDHATNVAEIIHFLVEGRVLEEARPKSDRSSQTIVASEPAMPTGSDNA